MKKNGDILIDGETRKRLGNLIKANKVDIDKVRGKTQSVDIYHLERVLA